MLVDRESTKCTLIGTEVAILFCVYKIHTVNYGDLLMNSRAVIRMLEEDGWVLDRTRGSHHHFKHPIKKGLVTVPHPNKDLPVGTVNSIRKQAGLK